MRLVAVVLSIGVVLVAGCATGTKKQAVKSQPVAQRTYQQETSVSSYDYEDPYASVLNDQSAKNLSVDSGAQLSDKQIQRALKNAGFYKGGIDGKIGSKTKEAIVRFQKAKGLKADGIVGKRTTTELRKYL